MVGGNWSRAPGIHLDAGALLALRDAAVPRGGPQAARRSGTMPSRQPGSGMDLREIRTYVPGDDPRRLDASATARTGRPHVRALNEDRDDITLVIADFRPCMLWGTAEALRSVRAAGHLAALGWQAARRGGAVGLVVAETEGARALAPATGDAQMAALCRMLADRHAAALSAGRATPTLSEALALADRTAPRGAMIRLASLPGGWTGAEAALSRLARGRPVEVAVILDPLEVAPPDLPLPVRNDGRQRLALLSPGGDWTAGLRALGAAGHEVAP